jgi:hypothetical protein
VSGTETGRGAPTTRRQLSTTGDSTRRLIILGGVAMLIGAVVIAFTGREEPLPLPSSAPAGSPTDPAVVAPAPVRRRRRNRAGLGSWEHGVPLNPSKRELARRRAGVSAYSYFGGEPEA